MNLLLFSNFNNYYNRIAKYFSDFEEYERRADFLVQNVNFNENDGVTAEVVIDITKYESKSKMFDYLIAFGEEKNVFTRWFIIDSTRIRRYQYRCSLRRDVIADFREPILKAPVFIEKARLDISDPFILNSENMSVNQIKKSEIQLSEFNNVAWIVGYIAKTAHDHVEVDSEAIQYQLSADLSVSTWNKNFIDMNSEHVYYEYIGQVEASQISYRIYPNTNKIVRYFEGRTITKDAGLSQTSINTLKTILVSDDNYSSDYSVVNTYGNKYVKDVSVAQSTDVYLMNVVNANEYSFTVTNNGNIDTICKNCITIAFRDGTSFVDKKYHSGQAVKFNKQLQSATAVGVYLSNKISCQNAVYDMFCIPYPLEQMTIEYTATNSAPYDTRTIVSNPDYVMRIASKLATQLDANCYDIQLLPYCPIDSVTYNATYQKLEVRGHISWIEGLVETVGALIWCQSSQRSFRLEKSIIYPFTLNLNDPFAYKTEISTSMFRLASPNFASMFDFHPLKNIEPSQIRSNSTVIDYFDVDCNFKPYNPYIKLSPNFGYLYGRDFNDSRGLILSGDFSIPRTSDAWASYQLQNKNYQAMFDRQIENMEINNSWKMAETAVGAVGSIAKGGAAGFLSSGGNPLAAVGGAAVGMLEGGLNIAETLALQKETMDYTKDMFGMKLDNIKALPNTVQKVGIFNANYKFFPILESYSCTSQEWNAFYNKIKYNGMTVGRIDTIGNYLSDEYEYIKGKLIRLEIPEDMHMITTISEELNKGVFINGI